MSKEIGDILTLLVESCPPGELEEAYNDLIVMFPAQKALINKIIGRLAEKQGLVLNGRGIAFEANKDEGSGKFWDYKQKKKYNADFKGSRCFDVETGNPDVEFPTFYEELSEQIQSYGEQHFPSQFEYEIVPRSTSLYISFVGQKLNKSNFYTGRWKGAYTFDQAKKAHGEISLDIHYYEEGNVRLESTETTDDTCEFSASAILKYIEQCENAVLIKVVNQFTTLNQKYFKNLRRLLPVTKSRINWGNAIGNYKLGTDVINEQ